MKLQEIIVFGSLIAIVGILFYTSGGNLSNLDELPSEFDGVNVVYPAGDTFVLTFNAKSTSDRETMVNSESEKYPYSESWVDIGNGKYDKGEDFVDTRNSKNGKWDKGEKFTDTAKKNGVYNKGEDFVDANGNGKWDTGEKFTDTAKKNGVYNKGEKFVDTRNSKNGKWDKGEKYTDIPDGEYTPYDENGNPFEKFTDSDLSGSWTRDLLEFRWEKVTLKDSWKEQTTPLSSKSVSEPWLLEYEGNDQGRIQIRLTVVDYRSTNRNEKGIVLSEKEWDFNCERLLEKAPEIESKKVGLSYNYNY
ncbi:MAG: hypothetical protein CMG13_03325 [Candidatus Marinimicrobia bacterium]|nr:hypothetical protein [Candidatus Neomarinimicrobiota bacterium]